MRDGQWNFDHPPISEKRGRGLGAKRRERPGAHLLGVIAMFGRRPLSEEEFERFAVFANGAAIAIKNAQLLTEIEQLKNRLQVESLYLREEITLEHNKILEDFCNVRGSCCKTGWENTCRL